MHCWQERNPIPFEDSALCKWARREIDFLTKKVYNYDIYGYCYYQEDKLDIESESDGESYGDVEKEDAYRYADRNAFQQEVFLKKAR